MSEASTHALNLAERSQCLVFFRDLLGLPIDGRYEQLAAKVAEIERHRPTILSRGTLFNRSLRKQGSASAAARQSLRRRIVHELVSQERPRKDDDLCLGEHGGGALPRSSLKHSRFACVVLGAPASGKSSISSTIADEKGAVILDADFAKRKLPEYDNGRGADLLHAESSELVHSFGGLFEWAVEQEANIVSVMVGRDAKKLSVHIADLEELGYEVTLVTTIIDPAEAARRALLRFESTGRYVPLWYVFSEVGRTPESTFRTLVQQGKVKNYGSIDTNGRPETSYWAECSGICRGVGLGCRCKPHESPSEEIEQKNSKEVAR